MRNVLMVSRVWRIGLAAAGPVVRKLTPARNARGGCVQPLPRSLAAGYSLVYKNDIMRTHLSTRNDITVYRGPA